MLMMTHPTFTLAFLQMLTLLVKRKELVALLVGTLFSKDQKVTFPISMAQQKANFYLTIHNPIRSH